VLWRKHCCSMLSCFFFSACILLGTYTVHWYNILNAQLFPACYILWKRGNLQEQWIPLGLWTTQKHGDRRRVAWDCWETWILITPRSVPHGLIVCHKGLVQTKTGDRDDSGRIYRPSRGLSPFDGGRTDTAEVAWILETRRYSTRRQHYNRTPHDLKGPVTTKTKTTTHATCEGTKRNAIANIGWWKTYFSCIYELLQEDATNAETFSYLNCLKAKLVCLQHQKLHKILIDTDDADWLRESPTLYTVLQMKRRESHHCLTGREWCYLDDTRWESPKEDNVSTEQIWQFQSRRQAYNGCWKSYKHLATQTTRTISQNPLMRQNSTKLSAPGGDEG